MGDTNRKCQLGWQFEGNRFWTFYSVNLTDDYVQNRMLFKKKYLLSTIFYGLSKVCHQYAQFNLT